MSYVYGLLTGIAQFSSQAWEPGERSGQGLRASYFSHPHPDPPWISSEGFAGCIKEMRLKLAFSSFTNDSVLLRTDAFLQSPLSTSNNTCGNGLPRGQCIHSLNMVSQPDEIVQLPQRDPSSISDVYLYKQQQLSSMINIGIANKY